MSSMELHFHTLRTSDQERSVMKTQAWRGSGRAPESDAELSGASEEEVGGLSSQKEGPVAWHGSIQDRGVSEELK